MFPSIGMMTGLGTKSEYRAFVLQESSQNRKHFHLVCPKPVLTLENWFRN
jgi:hypothetical protein